MTPLLAQVDAPENLRLWVGGVVLAAASSLLTRWLTRGDKHEAERAQAEADAKAETRSRFERLVELVQQLSTSVAVQARDIATLHGRMEGLDKRQEAQAEYHRDVINALKTEFGRPRNE